MGMFDYIKVPALGDISFQTKDLECVMSSVTINEQGKLIAADDSYYTQSGLGQFCGCINFYSEEPKTGRWVDYRATVRNGQCSMIEKMLPSGWKIKIRYDKKKRKV